MTQSKHTKRALLTSVLSVVACCALLIGSTFAWFTDEVESGNNRIVAGNLDVEVYHGDDLSEPVNGSTELFAGINWEPGVVAYENFKIVNEGSLALDYLFSLNAYAFNTVDNGKSLKDVIQIAVVENETIAQTDGREAALKLAEGEFKPFEDFAFEGALETTGSAKTLAIVLYWKPGADDNTYNLQNGRRADDGTASLYLKLGMQLTATQRPYEQDSFGDDYDTSAAVRTEEDFLKAVTAGGNVVLWDDIALSEQLTIDNAATIDLNGRTLTIDSANTSTTPIRVEEGGALTITGNGIIDASKASDDTVPVCAMGGAVTIESGTILVDTPNESCAYAMYGGTLTVTGGTFVNRSTEDYVHGGGAPLTLNNSNKQPGTIIVTGGTFQGRNPAVGDDHLGGTFVAEGYVSTELPDGRFVVAPEGTAPTIDNDTLTDALEKGGSVTLADTFALTSPVEMNGGTDTTLDLGGQTVTLDDAGILDVKEDATLTIKGNGAMSQELTSDFGYLIRTYNEAKVIIEDGVYTAGLTCVQAGNNSVVEIRGGHFEALVTWNNTYWLLNLIDNTDAQIVVRGGTFVNYDPSHSMTEPNAPEGKNFVADGYKVVSETQANGDVWYTVVPA